MGSMMEHNDSQERGLRGMNEEAERPFMLQVFVPETEDVKSGWWGVRTRGRFQNNPGSKEPCVLTGCRKGRKGSSPRDLQPGCRGVPGP